MLKKVLSLTVLMSFSAFALVTALLPTTATAQSTASDAMLVTLNVTEEITISDQGTVALTALSVTNLETVGAAAWTVITNAEGGYDMTVDASTAPAMANQGTGTDISDLPAASPAAWDTAKAAAGDGVYFGVSAYGDDVLDATWGAGSTCGTTTVPTDLNYDGFASGTPLNVATEATGPTSTTGTVTNVCFAAEQYNQFAEDGSYQATVTATATAN